MSSPPDGAVQVPRDPGRLQGEPAFEVLGVEPQAAAAAPTLVFSLRAQVPDRDVYTIALTADIQIEPARRRYDDATRAGLVDLFGTPERWAATTQNVLLARAGALLPSFTDSTGFTLSVPCTYDLEVAATKYFYSVTDGDVPLIFNFSGTVLYAGEGGRLQMEQVPWSCSTRFGMPVDVWRRMIALHYLSSGWIRLHADTLARLRQRAAERGSPSLDACVAELLGEAGT